MSSFNNSDSNYNFKSYFNNKETEEKKSILDP